ncbi:CPBP family intramembrane glutamic endopeptidase [Streptomyces chiangmaiensis]|uniref:CPBP family intramembrane glutamic endopeptidase n=1 Tax=Streptomyces chiangmaiensis TaxID=766497 RepID=A0ABU7FG95_9ACTN|nr:CPBP family intramembrane glutamic endopeptidase [Streptomyces chiangmaiensis]MED7822955.1 CPBP family intramembrane glutamic endopeptidase [Streptomyces chiangmaiensis]
MQSLLLAVSVLAAASTLTTVLSDDWYVPACVTAAALLVTIARRAGLSWEELGLGRASAQRGLDWGLVLGGAVLAVYLLAWHLPLTHEAFKDKRAAGHSSAEQLFRVLVRVPFGTVLLEEVGFRGVLWALITRLRGPVWATAVSSTLFGLWHVAPSRGLTKANTAAEAVFGAGKPGVILSVASAVVGTGIAGVLLCELRRRSGSLIPPMAVHCALNSFGYALSWAATHGE